MTEPQARIHLDNPFAVPPELREPGRRLRGRLAAPVTLWTSGGPEARAGLTVSSVLVAQGEPWRLVGLLGDTSELWEAINDTRAFVVHILEEEHRELAERFALSRPSPGGLFRGLDIEDSSWGPVVPALGSRAYCRQEGLTEAGYHNLVTGAIEQVVLHELERPLVFFRGRYRRLDSHTTAPPSPAGP